MKEVLRELTGNLVALAVVLLLGIYIYYRVKKDAKENLPSMEKVAGGIKDIATDAPSALVSFIKGESDAGYITSEQQRAQAAAALAKKRAAAGA